MTTENEAGIRFVRALKCLGAARNDCDHAAEIAERAYPDDKGIQNMLRASGRLGVFSTLVVRAARKKQSQ
jgi:hypothetical protein